MSCVIAAFGLLPLVAIPAITMLAFLVGLLFAGLGLWISAKVPTIDAFQYSIYLLVTPMMLFSGTFFPLAQLPYWAHKVALLLPLTHAVLALRPMVYGTWNVPWQSLAYLALIAFAVCATAIHAMKRKLAA
jgi:lipooligosaccharide transport system permease protein